MSTVTFASGVHAGTRDPNTDMTKAWFSASTTAQFSTFSLTSASGTPKTGPQAIQGHASLKDQPVEFTVQRAARDILTDSLATIAVQGLLNGRPWVTVSSPPWRDAGANSGMLAKVSWSERRNDGGAAESHERWGIIQIAEAGVRGHQELLRVLVWPCDALFHVGTNDWWVTPSAYASLDAS